MPAAVSLPEKPYVSRKACGLGTVTSVPTYDTGYDITYGLVLYRQLDRAISAVGSSCDLGILLQYLTISLTVSYDVAYDIAYGTSRYIGVISRKAYDVCTIF